MSSDNIKQKIYQKEYLVIKDKPKTEPIYIMTLELEKGNPERIEIYPDSDPQKLATHFCKKHNLDYNGLDYLKQKIENLLKLKNDNNKDRIKQISPNNTPMNHLRKYINNKESERSDNIMEKNNNKSNQGLNTTSKRYYNKTKKKISHCVKEKQYKDNKTENKYNARLKQKINQIENIKVNNTDNINKEKPIKKYKSFKKEEYKAKENQKELKEFKKQINKSKSIRNKRNDNSNKIFESKTYKYKTKDIICSRISKEYENNQFSFHPSINENYKTDLTFAERQTFYKNLYNKRKNELSKFYLQKKDQNGNSFFRPNLISKTFYEKNNNKDNNEEDIFQKNYRIYKIYDLNREKLIKKYKNNNQQNKQVIITKKINEKIFKENKIRAFDNLFNYLDSDQDGKISGINFRLNKIPKKIINIIQPLLIELKEDNQTLNKEEFAFAMDKLFEDISLIEKREIINRFKNVYRRNKSLDLINNNSQSIQINQNNTYNNFYINNNTNTDKLAVNYYNKMVRLFNELSSTNKNKNRKILKKNSDNNLCIYKSNYSYNNNISDCTFNNYIKNLN